MLGCDEEPGLEQTRIVAAANEAAGRPVSVAPGARRTVGARPSRRRSSPPPCTRETASNGYRRALAAAPRGGPDLPRGPRITEALERQMQALSRYSPTGTRPHARPRTCSSDLMPDLA